MSQAGEADDGNAAAGSPDARAGVATFAAVVAVAANGPAAAIALQTRIEPGIAGPLRPGADGRKASSLRS
jgi:hypothetical protein